MTNPNNSWFSKIRGWLPNGASSGETPGVEEPPEPQERDYAAIAPTAVQVARFRAFSDIPFAREMAIEMTAGNPKSGELELGREEFIRKAGVAFEARFKGINAMLDACPKIKNFVEIPAGFSTRGMERTRANREITYIECDFEAVIRAKQNLAARLLDGAAVDYRNRLIFQAADILQEDDLLRINKMLPRGPVAIITEGLLNYFSREEKARAAQNIHRILSTRGGVWVVTDLTFLFPPSDPDAGALREHVATVTGFNPAEGFFVSIPQARRFFEAQGFRIQEHPRSRVTGRLSAATVSALGPDKVAALLESQVDFALEV